MRSVVVGAKPFRAAGARFPRWGRVWCCRLFFVVGVVGGVGPTAQGAPAKTCNLHGDFDKNLNVLSKWCSKNKIPNQQCDSFLDVAAARSSKEFEALLKTQPVPSAPSLSRPATGSETKTSSAPPSTSPSPSLWSSADIPKKPKEAYQHLLELNRASSGTGLKTVEFTKKAGDYFETLKPAEVKHVYEIVEKMKTSRTTSDLSQFLKSKNGEWLKDNKKTRRHCPGTRVYAVRLSQGSRMCFEFDPHSESSAIKILCIGAGRSCYEH